MWIVFRVCGCNHKVFIYVCSGGHIAQFTYITPQSTFVDCQSGESAFNALSGYLPQSPGICSRSYVPSQSKCMQMILHWWDVVVSILSRCSHGRTKRGLDVLFTAGSIPINCSDDNSNILPCLYSTAEKLCDLAAGASCYSYTLCTLPL